MATLIPITATMVTPLSSSPGNYQSLFDGNQDTYWFSGWQASNYPAKIVIDLSILTAIEYIKVWDGTGNPTLKLSFAEVPNQITREITHKLEKYNDWSEIAVNKSARYIYVELLSPEGDKPIGALEIYGVSAGVNNPTPPITPPVTPPITPPSPTSPITITYKDASLAICTNSFHWVPTDLVKPFSMVREYNSWVWFEGTQGLNTFEPSYQSDAKLDTHFAALKTAGVAPIFCVHECPPWMNNYTGFDADNLPMDNPAGNSENPLNYKAYARFLWQVAARYGRKTYANARLTVDTSVAPGGWPPPNVKKSGLDLLNYISPWNEPDKWWKEPRGNFKPAQFAALLSACWDGHEGRIAGDYGIKTADPSMKIVLGGLVDMNVSYLQAMDDWFKANRTDKLFCADIIDVHHYSGNYGRDLFATTAKGISPEADNLKSLLAPLVDYKYRNHPNKELWLSEFGYDTGIRSPQRAPAYGNFTAEDVQAMWNIRSYMEIIAAGVDRGFVFNIYDESNNPDVLYQTSGILRSQADGYAKKVSWNKINELSTQLRGLVFKGDQSNNPNTQRVYLFANADNTRQIAVIWSPTANGTVISNFQYGGKTIQVSEMPSIVDVNVSVITPPVTPPVTPPTAGTGTKKVAVKILDSSLLHNITHDLTLAAADEIWVNGVKLNGDIMLEIRRTSLPAQTAPLMSAPIQAAATAELPPPPTGAKLAKIAASIADKNGTNTAAARTTAAYKAPSTQPSKV
jgi:hypothetical protein